MIETDDGATIMSEWHGYGRAYPAGRRQIVGSVFHLERQRALQPLKRRRLRLRRRGAKTRPIPPSCSRIMAARSAFTKACPAPTSGWQMLGATVQLAGIGFWNPVKTTLGALGNGAELRPVTYFNLLQGCGKSG